MYLQVVLFFLFKMIFFGLWVFMPSKTSVCPQPHKYTTATVCECLCSREYSDRMCSMIFMSITWILLEQNEIKNSITTLTIIKCIINCVQIYNETNFQFLQLFSKYFVVFFFLLRYTFLSKSQHYIFIISQNTVLSTDIARVVHTIHVEQI